MTCDSQFGVLQFRCGLARSCDGSCTPHLLEFLDLFRHLSMSALVTRASPIPSRITVFMSSSGSDTMTVFSPLETRFEISCLPRETLCRSCLPRETLYAKDSTHELHYHVECSFVYSVQRATLATLSHRTGESVCHTDGDRHILR